MKRFVGHFAIIVNRAPSFNPTWRVVEAHPSSSLLLVFYKDSEKIENNDRARNLFTHFIRIKVESADRWRSPMSQHYSLNGEKGSL